LEDGASETAFHSKHVADLKKRRKKPSRLNDDLRKQQSELSEEVLAVLECSPNLEPCKEFYAADIYRFVDYLKEEKWQHFLGLF